VKKLKLWGMVGLAAMGIALSGALSGCGSSSDSSSSTSVRLINATLTHSSLDLWVNAAVAASDVKTDTAGSYVAPASGTNTLQVNDKGLGTALATSAVTLAGGNYYALVAYESGGTVKTVVLSESLTAPTTANVTTLRIYDAAIEAGALDVYVTQLACTSANLATLSATLSFGTLSAPTSLSVSQGSGAYNVCVTSAGSKTDLRMSLPITITGQTVATVVMTPTSGGALINGALLIQQGTYTAVRNTNSRVRLAGAVSVQSSGASSVVGASSSDGTVIDSGSVAPSFGFYALVPASSSLNVTVNSATVAVTSGALAAGGDATLLVYGAPGSATATLIADDNRPPTSSAATKLRLINGVTGSTGTLTLTANNSPVGINVASASASTYQSLVGLTNSAGTAGTFAFALSSSTAGPLTLPTSSATGTLNANTAYSILATGTVSAPLLLIR